jgi:hypothetical protein
MFKNEHIQTPEIEAIFYFDEASKAAELKLFMNCMNITTNSQWQQQQQTQIIVTAK